MQKTINTTIFILIILILMFSLFLSNRNKPDLSDFIENKLAENENRINNQIHELELKIDSVLESDRHTSNKIENLKGSINQIINSQKKLNNEKLKSDIQIIHSDDSSHWEWLDKRFPRTKTDNELSGSTDQTLL
jgi:peptidoglycan hydrolase CwlO-like protein